jgi:hypothetical protein
VHPARPTLLEHDSVVGCSVTLALCWPVCRLAEF